MSVLHITLIVAPGPAHAEGNLFGGMMRAITPLLFATALGDFRRSGSHEDQARFRLLRQQFQSTVRSSRTHYWNEWLGSVTPLSHRAPRLACSLVRRTFRSFVASPNLCHMQWDGASRRRVPNDAPIFPPQLRTLGFLTTSSTHSLCASRLSRPCTILGDLMLPSLTTNSLLRCPSATSLLPVRTASHTHSSKSHFGVIFCSPSSTSCCASPWSRPLGSPASSSRSSSATVTPPPLIPIVLFLSHLALSNFSST